MHLVMLICQAWEHGLHPRWGENLLRVACNADQVLVCIQPGDRHRCAGLREGSAVICIYKSPVMVAYHMAPTLLLVISLGCIPILVLAVAADLHCWTPPRNT